MTIAMLLENKLSKLVKRKDVLTQYLKEKLEEKDFHAVQDVCSDIREIEREEKCISNMLLLVSERNDNKSESHINSGKIGE